MSITNNQVKIKEIFETVELNAQVIRQYWREFCVEVSKNLPDSYQSEIERLSEDLDQSTETLIHKLRNPVLTIATTGTTSSGKSTLVNMLCEANVMPAAVGEMSAGAVTITHSDEKLLIVHQTSGAKWQCGEWKNITDDEIRSYLSNAMELYHEHKQDSNIESPRFDLYYPLKRLREQVLFGLQLPEGTEIKLLDLPGLAHVGDKNNSEVINECRNALCIVTYNSAETDENKKNILLSQVVERVKELRGSPARMLFVLNKIDSFRHDEDWARSEQKFSEKTTKSIKEILESKLEQYSEDIQQIEAQKLSTYPALLAIKIRQMQNSDIDICNNAINNCMYLLSDTMRSEKINPFSPETWTPEEIECVAKTLWNKSYAEEFHVNLFKHIDLHFPQLIIPQLIKEYHELAGKNIRQWATQTTSAQINSSQENYDAACRRIVAIEGELNSILEAGSFRLNKPFQEIERESSEDPSKEKISLFIDKLTAAGNLKPYSLLSKGKLSPLYKWSTDLGEGINAILTIVDKSLGNGVVDLDTVHIQKVDSKQVSLLRNCLEKLIVLGYKGTNATNGMKVEAKTEDEKSMLKALDKELNSLSLNLSVVIKDVLNKILSQDIEAVYETVNNIFECHLSDLESEANTAIRKMNDENVVKLDIDIVFLKSMLDKIQIKFQFDLNFDDGFLIVERKYSEKLDLAGAVSNSISNANKRGQTIVEGVIEEASEEVIAFARRIWGTTTSYSDSNRAQGVVSKLLGEATGKPVYQERESLNADIPGIKDLRTKWREQAKIVEEKISSEIIEGILEEIEVLKSTVKKEQIEVVRNYKSKLDKAQQEVKLSYQEQQSIWQPIDQKAQNIKNILSSFEFEELVDKINIDRAQL